MPQKKKLPFVTVGFVAVNVLVYVIREIHGKFGVYGKNGGGLAAICEAGRILETVYSYFYAFWI